MLTLAQLADSLGGVWHGNAKHAISGFSSLVRATPNDLTYFDNPIMIHSLTETSAGAVLIKPEHKELCPVNCIVVSHPLNAMQKALTLLSLPDCAHSGIDETAQIHPTAQLGTDVSIGAFSVIGPNVCLADGVRIGSNTTIESSVRIGTETRVGSGVMLHSGCQLGAQVLINSGCVIGASPFNYLKQQGAWLPGASVGGVVLEHGVHIGANTVIDRGALNDTYLAAGVCVDNLVQIAHDVVIGAHTVVAGCSAIGAYVQIGADCIIGGASSIAAYVQLADDVVISGMSSVSKSITKSGIYTSGTMVHEHDRWRKNAARFKRLDEYIVRLSTLEKRVNEDF